MKGKNLSITLVLVLLLSALIGITGAGAAPKSALTVTLSADKASFSAAEAVTITVTISNTGKTPAKVLKWFTPAEDVEEALFKVNRDGSAVAYIGAHYKRPPATGNDYLSLKPGESLTRTVNLGAYYDLSASGMYELEYDADAFGLASNKLQIAVEGRVAPELVIVPEAVTGSTSFVKCTTSQQSSLLTARTEASNYSANALSYLNGNNQGPRYTTWFGVYNSSRYNIVKNNFTAISNAMDNASVTFNCGCKKPYYAYVYPTQPYIIYPCKYFWSAPLTGTDSRAGTLIHEMSHFNVVASTDDYAYGQTNAKNLAISDPNKAIANADSHEYFAENTPALP